MAEYDGGNVSNIGQGEPYGGGDATTEYTSTAMDGGYASLDDADITPSTILMRRDTEANWEAENPVLAEGEMGVVIDKRYFKIGDGVNNWNSLKGYGFDGNIAQSTGQGENTVMSQKAVTDAINAEKTRAEEQENALRTSISTETTKLTNANTEIKNTMVKSCVSENEALNDIVKELYFDRWCDATKISTIHFKRNGLAGSNIVWELYLIDSNGTSHWVSFGSTAEKQDVNVAKVGWNENTTSALFSESNRNKVTCYAVIDWTKLTDQQGGDKTDTIANPKIKINVNYNKYFPQINTCITTHKYVHDVEANSIIKELYFENLTRNGVAITDYVFRNEFSLARIDKGVHDSNGNPMWSLVFSVKNDNDSGHFFIYTYSNPEASIVWSKAASNTIGGVVYSGTVYAVIDWAKILYGNAVSFNQPLLNGCLKLSDSPIINDYIASPVTKIKWSESFNLNDYKKQGIYYITGERLKSEYDNLPIANAASGHSISGQLTVLDASLSDAEMCVTQYLKLSNRLGREGKEYIRTYNRFKDGREEWSLWRELKGTMNLNQISERELNNYTENGTYEGVINNKDASSAEQILSNIDAFLSALDRGNTGILPTGMFFTMEVLNNYAVTKYMNQILGEEIPQTIIQRAKCVLPTYQYIEIYRIRIGDEGFGAWTKINKL